MTLLQNFLFIVSLIQVHYFVRSQSAVWRTVPNAALTCSSYTEDSSTTVDACNQTCSTYGKNCLSYAVSSSNCLIYNTRFGFGSCQLEVNNDYSYYEKPVDIDDHYNDTLIQSQAVNGVQTFLSRFRKGVTGYVSIIEGTDTLEVKYGVSAEECAKYCTRRRGVIDDVVGTRCDSFNYEPSRKICHLTSITLDSTHGINLGNKTWEYYDRLKGTGCWITQEHCRHLNDAQYTGNFEVSNVSYEFQCVDYAKYYHETICDNYVNVSTVSVWGGNNESVFDAWNSWDLTTGCVIDVSNYCPGTRFFGTFRDSIGEDQYAAWFKADYCFERADAWLTYCNITGTEQMNISFPDTNSYKIIPVSNCACDDKGQRIDIATNRAFCTRDTTAYCWRTNQQDYWYYPDILCDDTTCPVYNSATQNQSQTHCYFSNFVCHNGNYPSSDYFLVPCPAANYSNGVCHYDETSCLANAEIYHGLCDNSQTDSLEQLAVFYMPTGAMEVYPPFSEPASSSLIRGIYGDASYTTYNSSDISLISLGDGKWMAFTALKTATVREITVFWYSNQEVSLTLAFYEGTGTTGTTKLTSTTATFSASTDSTGDYINFPIDSIDVTSGTTYTWEVTSADSNNDAGYIGYIPGNLYGNGGGDLTFDYMFVEWIEYYTSTPQALFAAITSSGKSRPWFEIWFIIGLILFVLFALFLLYLHYQRKRNEKKAQEEERKMQAEAKKRARLQVQANNEDLDDNADKYVALNSGDSPKGSTNDNKHINSSSIIEEEPNTNLNTTDNDNEDDNENDDDDDENQQQ